jgi:hypothetical protein
VRAVQTVIRMEFPIGSGASVLGFKRHLLGKPDILPDAPLRDAQRPAAGFASGALVRMAARGAPGGGFRRTAARCSAGSASRRRYKSAIEAGLGLVVKALLSETNQYNFEAQLFCVTKYKRPRPLYVFSLNKGKSGRSFRNELHVC